MGERQPLTILPMSEWNTRESAEERMASDTMKLLADKTVNTGRQPEIDMAKAACIFLMIMLHTCQGLSADSESASMRFLGASAGLLGAGAFMVYMGIGMRYSRHQDPKSNVVRGIALLTTSQVFNLLRLAIPGLIAFHATGNRQFIPYMLEVIQSDILTFAGLAFLLMALMKKLELRDGWILAIGIVMNLLMIPLENIIKTPEAYWPNRILNLFIQTKNSLFPLGVDFVFVAFGYLIGGLYTRIPDKNRMANRILLICLPISVIYVTLRLNVPFPLMPEYNLAYEPCMGPDGAVICLNSIILLAVMYKISRLTGGKIPFFVNHLSKNINRYYCIHDVLAGSASVILLATGCELPHGQWLPLLSGLLVVAACYFFIEINRKYIHFTLNGLQGSTRIIVYSAVWIVSLLLVFYALPLVRDPADMISPLV